MRVYIKNHLPFLRRPKVHKENSKFMRMISTHKVNLSLKIYLEGFKPSSVFQFWLFHSVSLKVFLWNLFLSFFFIFVVVFIFHFGSKNNWRNRVFLNLLKQTNQLNAHSLLCLYGYSIYTYIDHKLLFVISILIKLIYIF